MSLPFAKISINSVILVTIKYIGTDMKRFWILLVAIAALLPLAGCYEDEIEIIPDNVMHPGDHKIFMLEHEVRNLSETEVECVLKDSLGNIFTREANVNYLSGKTEFNLKYGLRGGYYNLLCVNFKSSNPNDMDGIESIGIGRYLDVKNGEINVVGAYNKTYDWGGSGTAEDPYQMCAAEDLYELQTAVNGDGGEKKFIGTYFVQMQDIDMREYSYYVNMEYGWQPIGKSYSNPFQGYYNGNGYAISGLYINRGEQSGIGLFGMLYNAVIENLTIKNSTLKGDGAVGALAGAARANGDGVPYVSIIRKCRVEGCDISGNVAVGGIMGMVDASTRVLIDSCYNDSSTKVNVVGYGAGGILGAGVYGSAVLLSSCENKAPVNGGLVNTGGIVGGADTLMIETCTNLGDVSASGSESRAVGGVVGGSGVAIILNVHNMGNVTGYKGVGGILGSTLINEESDGSNAIYNPAYIYSCHNEGKVHGNNRVAGICGESQMMANQCFNAGEIRADGSYVGGIIGTTAVSAIHDVANFADIYGNGNVGGIIGKVNEGSFASNVNIGNITATNGPVGGIIGKSGNQSMVHYCGNFGVMKINGNGNLGGIVGEVGDPRKWTGWDIVNVVIAGAEMGLAVFGVAVPAIAKCVGASAAVMEKITVAMAVKDVTTFIFDSMVYKFTAISQFVHCLNPTIENIEVMKNKMEVTAQNNYRMMDSLIFVKMKEKSAATGLDTASINRLDRNRLKAMDYYRASESNQESYNNKIDDCLQSRYEQVEENKRIDNAIHSIVSGVAIVASGLALIGGFFVTGGAALAVAAAGAAAGLVAGSNSVAKTVRNFESNAFEISQCYNFGKLDAPEDANAAGIAGKVVEYTYITDCINGGAYPKGSYAIAEEMGIDTQIDRSIDLYGTQVRAIAEYDIHTYNYDDNMILCNGKTEDDLEDLYYELGFMSQKTGLDPVSGRCILVPTTACKSSSYVNWSIGEDNLWVVHKEGEVGSFAVPNVSKMVKK